MLRCSCQRAALIAPPAVVFNRVHPGKATRAMAARFASNPTHYEMRGSVCFGRWPARMQEWSLHHLVDRIDRAS